LRDAAKRRTPTRRSAGAFTATTLAFLAASLLTTAPVQAAPGDLDGSFSGDGIALTGFGGESDGGAAVAVQVDRKIVIAGTTSSYDERGDSRSDIALARFDGDGSLDMSFSGDGKQITDFGAGTDSTAAAVAIQPDGKILVANMAPGTYTCTASASGYRPSSRDMTVIAGVKSTRDFDLVRR